MTKAGLISKKTNRSFSIGLTKIERSIKNLFSSILRVVSLGITTLIILGFLLSFLIMKEGAVTNSIAYLFSKLSDRKDKILTLWVDGQMQQTYASDVANSQWVQIYITDFYTSIAWGFFIASLVATFLIVLIVYVSLKKGDLGEKLLRGAREGSFDKLKNVSDLSPYTIMGVPYTRTQPNQSTFISGSSGSGKSNSIKELLDCVVDQNDKAFIYDRSGELTAQYYREGYDVILNPFDVRMPAWSIFSEFQYDYDFERLARSWIPDSKSSTSDPHWNDAARTVLAEIMSRMHQANDFSHSKLVKWITSESLEKLYGFLKGTPAANLISPENEKHSQSVLSVLAAKVKPLTYIHDTGVNDKLFGFSLRRWIQNKNDMRRVFFNPDKKQLDVMGSLFQLWTDLLVSELCSMPDDYDNKFWAVFDEFQSLPKLNSILAFVNEARKKGGCGVFSVTSIPALRGVYGDNDADTLMSTCGTKLAFRAGDPKAAELLSKLFGQQEIDRSTEQSSISEGNRAGSTNVGEHRDLRALFLPTEFLELPDMQAIIKVPGRDSAKVTSEYVHRPTLSHPRLESPEFALKTGVETDEDEGVPRDDGSVDIKQKKFGPIRPAKSSALQGKSKDKPSMQQGALL